MELVEVNGIIKPSFSFSVSELRGEAKKRGLTEIQSKEDLIKVLDVGQVMMLSRYFVVYYGYHVTLIDIFNSVRTFIITLRPYKFVNRSSNSDGFLVKNEKEYFYAAVIGTADQHPYINYTRIPSKFLKEKDEIRYFIKLSDGFIISTSQYLYRTYSNGKYKKFTGFPSQLELHPGIPKSYMNGMIMMKSLNLVITGMEDHYLVIWDPEKLECIDILDLHLDTRDPEKYDPPVYSLAVSEMKLAVGTSDDLHYFDFKNYSHGKKGLKHLIIGSGRVDGLSFISNSTRMTTLEYDKIMVYDIGDKELFESTEVEFPNRGDDTISGLVVFEFDLVTVFSTNDSMITFDTEQERTFYKYGESKGANEISLLNPLKEDLDKAYKKLSPFLIIPKVLVYDILGFL
jgi:hypothetical protein